MFYEFDNNIFFTDFGQEALRLSDGAKFVIVFEIKNDHEIFNPFALSGEDLSCYCKNEDILKHNLKKTDIIKIDNINYRVTRVRRTNFSLGELDLQYNED